MKHLTPLEHVELREGYGLSLTNAAREFSMPVNTLWRWETGRARISYVQSAGMQALLAAYRKKQIKELRRAKEVRLAREARVAKANRE